MPKLTDKQQRFVDEYLLDLNATQAAIRAGYSEKTAYSQGQRLLKNVEAQKAIQEAKRKRVERTQIDSDFVLKEAVEMYRMAKGEVESQVMIRDIDSEGGSTQYATSMKLTNVNGMGKALELIGKHVDIKAFDKDQQVHVGVTVIDPFKKQGDESEPG